MRLLIGLLAIAVGLALPFVIFHVGFAALGRSSMRVRERLSPYLLVGPALVLVTIGLVVPAVLTIIRSLYKGNGSLAFDEFVGLDVYADLFADPAIRDLLINNVVWILVAPGGSVLVGLLVAVLANNLRKRWENVAKSIIFLPMAISFVGAATVWKFVYAFRPAGEEQIGLLNAIVVQLGFDPQTWLTISSLRTNTLLLTVIVIWLQAGFATVLLSAAIKGVPAEIVEASQVDGANRWQSFRHVVLPSIRPAIIVVTTTIIILVMKVFDIVFATTGGNFNTDVIVNRFYQELFIFRAYGRASALTVLLVIAVLPIIVVNVRNFRSGRAVR